MRVVRLLVTFCLLAMACAKLNGQSAMTVNGQTASAGDMPVAAVKLEKVSLESVQADRLSFTARIGLYPERSITLRSLSFSAMRVNGLPVYVSPLVGKFGLKKEQLLELPDVQIVIYVRDLNSTRPLHEVLDKQKVTIAGQITAVIDGNLLEDVALRSLHPRVVLPFSKEMPIAIPGGDGGRAAALAMLDLADKVSPAAAKVLGQVFPGEDAAWRNDLMTQQIKHLVLVQTTYKYNELETSAIGFMELGFWIGPDTVLVPEEAVAPWEFDAGTQSEIKGEGTHVDLQSVRITVQPVVGMSDDGAASGAGGGAAWSFAQGDFRIEAEGKPAVSREVYTAPTRKVKVKQRGAGGNYALLRFREGITGDPVVAVARAQDSWDRLGVFRLVLDPATNTARVEVVFLPGSVNAGQIQLGERIDEAAYGSPMMTPDGAVGFVTDESSAALLTSVKELGGKGK